MSSPKNNNHTLERLKVNNAVLFILALVLLVTNFIGAFFVYRQINKTKTILTPVRISAPLEFVGNQLPESYLKDVTRLIFSLALDYHPASVRVNFDDLLKLYAPEAFEDAKRQFYSYAESVEKTQSVSSFYVQHIVFTEGDNRIMVDGLRKVDSKEKEDNYEKQEKWVIKYIVKDLKFEILSVKPFGGEDNV